MVRDTDGSHVRSADLVDDLAQRGGGDVPDLVGVVFDPTRRGVVLGELAVRGDRGSPIDEDRTAAHARGACVDRDHAAGVARSVHQRFLRLDDLGRLPPPVVRLVGAGFGRGSSLEVATVAASLPEPVAAPRTSFRRVR